MNGAFPREPLPAHDDRVAVDGVELDQPRASARGLGSYEGGSGTAEDIEHDLAPARAISDSVRHKGHRLYGRVHGKLFGSVGPNAADARVIPDIGAIAPSLAETEAIGVGRRPDLEHKDKLMLRAIEGAHASVGLVPDAEVLELREDVFARLKQLAHVAPVYADEGDRTVAACIRRWPKRLTEKLRELTVLHLPGGKRKLAMLNPT